MISLEQLNSVWNDFEEKIIRTYQIGSFALQISSPDASFTEKLTRAFAHLPSTQKNPDLKVRIWSGSKLPPLDWPLILENGYRGYVRGPIYFHYFEAIQALSAIDIEQNIAYFAVKDKEKLPWWVNGSPLQVILHVWAREKGMQLTHSAAIAGKKSSILLAGKGGSGKSTTVLACLYEGISTLGEDYLLLSEGRAYSVYQTAKWQKRTRTFFPNYEKHIVNPETADEQKALIYYKDLFPSQITLSSPVRAIISLNVGNALSLQKSDLLTSLQSLLLSTAMQLPYSNSRTSSSLRSFAEPLDHYLLTLGPDLKANVALLRELVE